MDPWPAWATERVEVVDPDPRWVVGGERECRAVEALAGRWLRGPVEHIGSTAVPGLAAKPVLDLQAGVDDLGVAPAVADALAPYGWHLVPPDLDDRPWRRFLVRVETSRRAAHLHLLRSGDPREAEQLAFRDALRADAGLRDAYAALKRGLGERHADDREAYTEGKTAFVRAALHRLHAG